jgi:cytochrome c553
MAEPTAQATRGPGVAASLLSVGAAALVAFLIGFIWLPSESLSKPLDLWASICRAAGVPGAWGVEETPPPPGPRTTGVVLSQAMGRPGSGDAVRRGAAFDHNKCAMCHGARGSHEANAPVLEGQHAEVVIKQLTDFQRGDRSNLVMHAMAQNLTKPEVLDLAAFYASVAKPAATVAGSGRAVPALVHVGDPMRNIAPCASCHGGIDHKLGAPRLEGMLKTYLDSQLRAFASGTRNNDSHSQMRNMARRMSGDEVVQIADFYDRQ